MRSASYVRADDTRCHRTTRGAIGVGLKLFRGLGGDKVASTADLDHVTAPGQSRPTEESPCCGGPFVRWQQETLMTSHDKSWRTGGKNNTNQQRPHFAESILE
ncbi:unnamed protein product [Durusdinium trenchii]|uniref:Uncharacterized protein n=1 Tax=Durusdinium trenchii TaxID=1381693 RepID=A0ABP0JG43_9DINO